MFKSNKIFIKVQTFKSFDQKLSLFSNLLEKHSVLLAKSLHNLIGINFIATSTNLI
jgi:hypothetical protein